MKTTKLWLVFLAVCSSQTSFAQIDLFYPERIQHLNQYTSVFISSPKSNTILQQVRNQAGLSLVHSDKYQFFNQAINYYQQLSQGGSTIMQPGVGYVLQLGGNGNYTDVQLDNIIQEFNGGSDNNGTISTPVTAGKYALLGNPYKDYLDLDYFLLNANNKTKIKGPISLWTHNTVISPNNPSGPDYSPYRYSQNDYAIYNVLGGVAAGRNISTSPENGTFAGIQVPSGKICFGTGFFVEAIGTGNVTFENNMRDNDPNITPQSFRTSSASQNTPAPTQSLLNPLVTRSRIWLNLEKLSALPVLNTPLKQILIGYSTGYNGENPTDGENDRVFDAEGSTATSYMSFYSYVPNTTNPNVTPGNPGTNTPLALGIQGRHIFNKNHFFQLGYKVTEAGNYTITTSKDGIFNTTPYYIYDAIDNQYHTLPYEFYTEVGTFDNRLKVVFENLAQISHPQVCGSTLTSIWTTLFSSQIAGATTYKYEVRDNSGNLIGEYDAIRPPHFVNYQFYLNIPGDIQYNSTYNVRVATYQVDGAWAYGPTCTITTPAPPQTQLISSSCNINLTSYSTNLFCSPVNELGFSSTKYRFEVREGSITGPIVGIVEKVNNNFQLTNLTAINGYVLLPNTQYFIRVQIEYNDSGTPTWQTDSMGNPIYGSHCIVTTPNFAPRLSNLSLNAKVYPNPFANNFKIELENMVHNSETSLFVYDMLGRLVESRTLKSEEINTLEIGANYSSGIYNVILKQGEKNKALRVIKQ